MEMGGNMRSGALPLREEQEQRAQGPLCLPLKSSRDRTPVLQPLRSFHRNRRGPVLSLRDFVLVS